MTTIDRLPIVALVAVAPAALAQFAEPGVIVHQEFTGAGQFGWAVSELTDIDGDGAMEAIVTAPSAPGGGRVVVYSGATGDVLMDLGPEGAGESFGWSGADAGDVNGDGVHDVIVGAPARGGNAGAVYIFSGAAAERGMLIRRVDSVSGIERFGSAVSWLGDVDGDGFGEVVVGAGQSDVTDPGDPTSNDGRSYVLSGSDGSVIHTIDGAEPGAQMGAGLGGLEDVDGDGVRDFAVGSTGASRADVFSGATGDPIIGPLEPTERAASFGTFFTGPAGDTNADGTPDVYVGDFSGGIGGHFYVYSGADGSVLHSISSTTPGVGFGLGCGRGAGDVDGDGHDDVISGSYLGNQATVFSGRTGQVIRFITYTRPGSQFGFDAVGIGDVTGDGLIDFLVGAATGNRALIISGAVCAADLDGDSDLTLFDFLEFQNLFDAEDPIADFDGDGTLTLFDFLAFQNAFDAGCA
ncbi:MAG: FG-GAP-like repeat-containing protein [Phycisphaerales bacterium]